MSMTEGGASASTRQPIEIAIAGNPNSGKTSIFNRLTGLRQKVANYPGVTIEKREGRLTGTDIVLLDLPGTYSLSARAPDEEIARDVLLGRIAGMKRPDAVLLILDANNLERNLYLASQILEFNMPVVIACNMIDVAERNGMPVDCAALSRELGVPVIPTAAHEGRGVAVLQQALVDLGKDARSNAKTRRWRLAAPIEDGLEKIATIMQRSEVLPAHVVHGGALLWLTDYLSGEERSRDSAERFLAKLNPADAEALRRAGDEVAGKFDDAPAEIIQARYVWISQVVGDVVRPAGTRTADSQLTDRIDRVLTHRVFGLLIFAAVMFLLFLSIFSWAEPMMSGIDAGFSALANWTSGVMSPGPLRSLLTDGVIKGVGAVIIFFPQICLLFLCLSILEDSGYMARAAFLMDRLMSRVGLHGKSFIPLLSSYACAIPGILATRTIENRRDRFTTIMVAPLMSCSARLPVYLIVISALFGDRIWLKTIVMFSMYLLGTITAMLMALLFKKTLFAGPRPAFILELPPYHLPRAGATLRVMWDRSKSFLTNAGTTIFAVCVIIWALSYFPRMQEGELSAETRSKLASLSDTDAEERDNLLAAEQLSHSFIGRIGHTIEPVIRPLGFDWRLGIGILSSFLAREVFVGTMGITFALGETDESSPALKDQLAAATWPDGRKLLTPAAGVGLMVFYVLACQCVSTLAVVRKETGTWRWPALMFAYMTVLAYVGALAVYQIGSRMG